MGVFVNFSNHLSMNWEESQIEKARNIGEIIDLQFPTVDENASEQEVEHFADECVSKILSLSPDAVMCQGEFTLSFCVVNRLMKNGVRCVAACSKRIVEESVMPDGTTEKKSFFVFSRFRDFVM